MGNMACNQHLRMDTLLYLLVSPMRPLLTTRTIEMVGFDQMGAGQNAMVCVMSYSGYDIEVRPPSPRIRDLSPPLPACGVAACLPSISPACRAHAFGTCVRPRTVFLACAFVRLPLAQGPGGSTVGVGRLLGASSLAGCAQVSCPAAAVRRRGGCSDAVVWCGAGLVLPVVRIRARRVYAACVTPPHVPPPQVLAWGTVFQVPQTVMLG